MAPTAEGSVPDIFTGRDQPVLRCAVYTRQSGANAEQDLTSCDVQRERCEDYVRAMQYEGWQLLDERSDDLGVSGVELSRPGLDKLKSWCVQGRVDIVVATRLDRLNRKMSHWVQLADWFKQAGIELVFVDGGTGARGPLADLVNNIVASFAELKKADPRTISDRRSRVLLEHLRPSWDTWSRADRNRMVRGLVWSVRWSPRRGLAGFTLDTIAIDNCIEQDGERLANLPPRRNT